MKDKKIFILKFGVIRFGLPAGILFILILEFMNNGVNFKFSNLFSLSSLIAIPLFLIGGIIWGLFMWNLMCSKK